MRRIPRTSFALTPTRPILSHLARFPLPPGLKDPPRYSVALWCPPPSAPQDLEPSPPPSGRLPRIPWVRPGPQGSLESTRESLKSLPMDEDSSPVR